MQPSEQTRSIRVRKAKVLESGDIDSELISFCLVEGNKDKVVRTIPIVLQVEDDPKTYKEAIASKDVIFWKDAIR